MQEKSNLIFEALAFLENYAPSPSMMQQSNSAKHYEVYLKNTAISLLTLRLHNPNTDIALVTNIDLEAHWLDLFRKHNILVFNCPYDNYQMPRELVYSLSYYKLCAYDYVLKNTQYERFCFVDCDTFGVGNFDPIWMEADSALLMIPNDYTLTAPIRKEINLLYQRMFTETKIVPHISSGFIAGTRADITKVLSQCALVHQKLKNLPDANPRGGDEVIWSLALANCPVSIYSPKGYVLLSNVGLKEYKVDKDDFRDPDIVIWHLPTEKRYALIWAYNYLVKKGYPPCIEKMAKACRLRRVRSHFTLLSIQAILLDKTAIKRQFIKIWRRISGTV